MNSAIVDRIASAVLYEGYILYPYRPSLKNRQRWTFGGLYPPSYSELHGGSDASAMQTQCLVFGGPSTTITVKGRCLHLLARTVGALDQPVANLWDGSELAFRAVESLRIGDQQFQSWHEAVEREIPLAMLRLGDLIARPQSQRFAFTPRRDLEPLHDPAGPIVGVLVREQQPLEGTIEVSADPQDEGLYRVTVTIANHSPLEDAAGKSRDDALMRSLVSTHTILGVEGGEFVSLIDPPARYQAAAAECHNIGAWPVLVGEPGETDAMLSAPIILDDYPRVAPESPGDLFDCTEIDEILTLRILTLTEDERRQVAGLDGRARALLERTETLARDQLLGLHGAVRGLRPCPGGPDHG